MHGTALSLVLSRAAHLAVFLRQLLFVVQWMAVAVIMFSFTVLAEKVTRTLATAADVVVAAVAAVAAGGAAVEEMNDMGVASILSRMALAFLCRARLIHPTICVFVGHVPTAHAHPSRAAVPVRQPCTHPISE